MNTAAGYPFRAWLWLLPLLGLGFLLNLGTAPLFDVDEGAFSAATWEMLQRGDYVTTYLNGDPRFDKPILIYWLQATCVSLFGIQEWSFRLPSAMAACAWVSAVHLFAVRRLDASSAGFAAAITATTLTVVVIGRAATADALLNLWLALAMFDVYRYAERPSRGAVLRVYLWMALGMLTKGPVAVAIPFGVSLIYFLSQGRFADWRRAAFNGLGWLLFLIVALPWYLLELMDQGQAFVDGFILKHNVRRFTDTMEGHGGSPFYYLLAIVPVLTPYGGAFLALLPGVRRLWRDPLDRWLVLWFAFVFVLFSLSSTQLPHYILYGCTPLFLLMARHREVLRSRSLAFVPAGVFFLLCLALPYLGSVVDLVVRLGLSEAAPGPYESALLESAADELAWTYRLVAVGMLALVGILWVRRDLPLFPALIGIGVLQVLYLVTIVTPSVGLTLQGPVKEAGLLARFLPDRVVTWRIDVPSFIVYRQKVTPRQHPQAGDVVLTRAGKLDPLGEFEVLLESGGIVLARMATDATD